MAIRPQRIAKRLNMKVEDLETAKADGNPPAKDCEAPLPLFPLRGGVFLPIGDGQKGGGLPNGARAKHSLATIKQGCRFMRS